MRWVAAILLCVAAGVGVVASWLPVGHLGLDLAGGMRWVARASYTLGPVELAKLERSFGSAVRVDGDEVVLELGPGDLGDVGAVERTERQLRGHSVRMRGADGEVFVTERDIEDVTVLFDADESLLVRLTPDGGERLGAYTAAHVDQTIALELDGNVLFEPMIREPIRGGSLVINLGNDQHSLLDTALGLRSVPLTLESVDRVGSTLPSWVGRPLRRSLVALGLLFALLGLVPKRPLRIVGGAGAALAVALGVYPMVLTLTLPSYASVLVVVPALVAGSIRGPWWVALLLGVATLGLGQLVLLAGGVVVGPAAGAVWALGLSLVVTAPVVSLTHLAASIEPPTTP